MCFSVTTIRAASCRSRSPGSPGKYRPTTATSHPEDGLRHGATTSTAAPGRFLNSDTDSAIRRSLSVIWPSRRTAISPEGVVSIAVDVENTGNRSGDEVVQLYVNDMVASVTRPVKELRGFRRIHLQPGERRTVEFRLSARDMALYDKNMKRIVEPGIFKIMVGRSSADILLEGEFLVHV